MTKKVLLVFLAFGLILSLMACPPIQTTEKAEDDDTSDKEIILNPVSEEYTGTWTSQSEEEIDGELVYFEKTLVINETSFAFSDTEIQGESSTTDLFRGNISEDDDAITFYLKEAKLDPNMLFGMNLVLTSSGITGITPNTWVPIEKIRQKFIEMAVITNNMTEAQAKVFVDMLYPTEGTIFLFLDQGQLILNCNLSDLTGSYTKPAEMTEEEYAYKTLNILEEMQFDQFEPSVDETYNEETLTTTYTYTNTPYYFADSTMVANGTYSIIEGESENDPDSFEINLTFTNNAMLETITAAYEIDSDSAITGTITINGTEYPAENYLNY